MELLEDLRFVIGIFFGVVSLILLAASYFVVASPQMSEAGNLNLLAGSFMLVFSVFMVTSALRARENVAKTEEKSVI